MREAILSAAVVSRGWRQVSGCHWVGRGLFILCAPVRFGLLDLEKRLPGRFAGGALQGSWLVRVAARSFRYPRVRRLADKELRMSALQSVAAPSNSALDAIVSRIDEISTLPHVAVQVMQIANDPTSDAGDLKLAMESDVSLSARVLRCVNSSAYATRRKITNLQQAIAYLGTKQIRNLAVTAAVSELFKNDESIGSYRRSNLWKHLVSVGICARMIAERLDSNEGEDIFLAGLLHDIGIVLEDQHVHDTFGKVIESLREGTSLSAMERNRFGFDHAMMGEKIGELWGFPDCVRAAIRYHHMSTSYRGTDGTAVRCVEVANLVCSLKGITSIGLQLVNFSQSAFSGLKLNKFDVASLGAELDAELEANQALFHV